MKRLLLFILICYSFSTFAQKSLISKPNGSGLFIHTDKTIYLKNETIWFSAYLLDTTKNRNLHHLLSLVISSADSGKIWIEEKYPMDNGISIGKIILPDSIKKGVYKLIAFTDVIDSALKPAAFFCSTITIGHQGVAETINRASANSQQQSNPIDAVKAELDLGQLEYGKREKVMLKIKLPNQGLFSVAAVYSNRLNDDQIKITDVNYNSAEKSLGNLQPPALIVKHNNKTLDKNIDLVLFGNKGINVFTTDQFGVLKLDRDALLMPYGKKIAVMISGRQARDYQVELHYPTDGTSEWLAKENIMSTTQLASRHYSGEPVLTNAMETIVELNAVTIKGSKKSSSVSLGRLGINDCGDWVDEYDYLNYPYSEKRYHPVIGTQYKKRTDLDPIARSFKVEPVYYTGCEIAAQKNSTLLKGINLKNPFYGLDNSSPRAQYLTTLFWNAAIVSNVNGEADLSFSTADLSGEYRIILQGITVKGVCYGEVAFVVK